MRLLVTGWFSFEHGEATAGDLRAAEVVCGWLDEAGIDYDLATSPAFAEGADWRAVDPGAYSDVQFVCGPFHGEQLDALVERFRDCRRTAVDVSLIPGSRPDFDVVYERDGGSTARPDLALASGQEEVPVVGDPRRSPGARDPDERPGGGGDRARGRGRHDPAPRPGPGAQGRDPRTGARPDPWRGEGVSPGRRPRLAARGRWPPRRRQCCPVHDDRELAAATYVRDDAPLAGQKLSPPEPSPHGGS